MSKTGDPFKDKHLDEEFNFDRFKDYDFDDDEEEDFDYEDDLNEKQDVDDNDEDEFVNFDEFSESDSLENVDLDEVKPLESDYESSIDKDYSKSGLNEQDYFQDTVTNKLSLDETQDKIKNNNLISANDLDVVVKCEIGKVSISLHDLMNLKIGSVLDITRWPNTVKLVANGIYFAEGYLVEVNNMLGVKITKKL